MGGSEGLPWVFLDVDGPLIPFGGTRQQYPDGYPTFAGRLVGQEGRGHPLLVRVDPAHGARLLGLPGELVWATTWMEDANECVAPWIGLPELPVVVWPEPSAVDEQDERDGLHWKTRALVEWADGRPFAWVDDEITDTDRAWVSVRHPVPALLHRVDARHGLTDNDYATLHEWLRSSAEECP